MPLGIEVVNRAETPDRFELEVEGLDPEWTAVPVPTFPVAGGDTGTEKVFFRPPRTPESQSGNYPFVIKLRSLTTGEQRTAQGVLQVQPYHHISAEISPKKGRVASFRRRAPFVLTLMNLGNTEHTLQLTGTDPEEALAYTYESDQVTLGPGQQKEVAVTVQPVTTPVLSTTRLHGFTLTARSTETPRVAAAAQAQLEQRPAFTPATLAFCLFVVAAGLAWWWVRPQTPKLEIFVSTDQVLLGQPVTVSWRMDHADRVKITAEGRTIYEGVQSPGSTNFIAKNGGPIDVTGVAIGADKSSEPVHAGFTVTVPPPAPLPEISEFTASSPKVRVGDPEILNYKFNDAVVKAVLEPLNQEVNVNADKIQITITDEGTKEFTLIAYNKDNKVVKKKVTVEAKRQSEVNVIAFTVSPKELTDPGGLVTVSWQLTNAVHAEIQPNANLDTPEVDATKGSFQMYVTKSTTFTLIAKDKNNLPQAATARVEVQKVTIPPPSNTTGASTPDTTPP